MYMYMYDRSDGRASDHLITAADPLGPITPGGLSTSNLITQSTTPDNKCSGVEDVAPILDLDHRMTALPLHSVLSHNFHPRCHA